MTTIDLSVRFGATDVIVLSDNLNTPLATLDDRSIIEAVFATLAEATEGWEVPEGGVPVAALRLNFRSGGEPLGSVGVDGSFLTAHVDGGFVSRPSDDGMAARMLGAAGLRRFLRRLTDDDESTATNS